MDNVEEFLNRFHLSSNIDEVFTSGCCYWFAFILFRRFIRDGATIMYDEVENHFGTRINGIAFDITGNVTEKYKWIEWVNLNDDAHKKRIIQECIMF